jgi:hypothetical protein
MMPRRLSRRGQLALAAGLLLVSLALIVIGVAWFTRPEPAPVPLSTTRLAKLLVAQPGLSEKSALVEIKSSDLRTIGWENFDLSTLKVTSEGVQLPTWATTTSLRFFAPLSPTRYISETVFWLEQSEQPVLQITDQPLTPTGDLVANDRYTATLRLEENRVYSPQVAEGDHWFWLQLPAPITKTFTLTTSALLPGPARLQINVWGSTAAPANPDHTYHLVLNDQVLGDFAWDGQGHHMIEAEIPAGVLREGSNTLTVTAPGLPQIDADITYLNWIALEYPRALVAQDDRLAFESLGGTHHLTGFSGPIDIFDVTQPDRITRTRAKADGTFVGIAGRRYWAVGAQGYQSAVVQAAQLTPDLRAVENAADYLAIGPSDLLEPVQPLLDWHTTEGLKTLAVPVDAIYDQFGAGHVDPDAIRSFLQYATTQWSVKPKYVLLVGDASYDTLNATTPPQANRLPTFLVQTVFGGETASDVGFAQLDGDEKPDVALGRVPAREADQVRVFVEKTLAYEQNAPSGEWRSRVLAVADGQDPAFHDEAQRFLDQFSSGFQTTLVNPPAGTAQANTEIVNDLNSGSALVGYFGHGSVTQWGKDNLFTVKDVASLQNGTKVPVVINMTCLTGLFTHPKVQSLTETLLWKADGGAVAVLAPTSLTLSDDQSFLSNALVQGYLKDRTARLGDIFLQAQRAVPTNGAGAQDVLRTFLLFGDPALRFVQP